MTDFKTLLEAHFNIFPLPKPSSSADGKTPYRGVTWKRPQPLSPQELADHFAKNPDDNIAIRTGRVSALTVVDVDAHNATPQELKDVFSELVLAFASSPVVVCTGGGGYHFYCKYAPVKNIVGISAHELFPSISLSNPVTIDIKNDNGYVVAPDSLHRSGKLYLFHPSYPLIPNQPLPNLPPVLLNNLKRTYDLNAPKAWQTQLQSPTQGVRHNTLISLTGLLLSRLPQSTWLSVVFPLIKSWNAYYAKPPLPAKELEVAFNSLVQKEKSKGK